MSNQDGFRSICKMPLLNIPELMVKATKEEVAAAAVARMQRIDPEYRVFLWNTEIYPKKEELEGRNCIHFLGQVPFEEASMEKVDRWRKDLMNFRPDLIIGVNPDLFMLAVLSLAAVDYGQPVVLGMTDTAIFDEALAVEKWSGMRSSFLQMKKLFGLARRVASE